MSVSVVAAVHDDSSSARQKSIFGLGPKAETGGVCPWVLYTACVRVAITIRHHQTLGKWWVWDPTQAPHIVFKPPVSSGLAQALLPPLARNVVSSSAAGGTGAEGSGHRGPTGRKPGGTVAMETG